MLAEAIETFEKLVADGNSPELLELDHALHSKSLVAIGGEIKEVEHEIPPRRHSAGDLETVGNWCGTGASVWYSMNRVQAILEDNPESHRQDRVTMHLTVHPKFEAAIGGFQMLNQSQVIQWIRKHLRAEFKATGLGLESTIRKLKFAKGGGGEGTVGHGKESFSSDVVAEVTGASDLPEDVTLRVPVWKELETTVELTLGLYIDAMEATFSLEPLTGEVVRAHNAALGALQTLVEENCSEAAIYRGEY